MTFVFLNLKNKPQNKMVFPFSSYSKIEIQLFSGSLMVFRFNFENEKHIPMIK